MFKPKCLIQPINEIYSSRKKKKKNPKLTACGVRAACLNKTKKSPNFLNSWIEIQRVKERERENPKPKSWKPETVTARPSLAAPLRLLTAAAAARSRHAHAPFASLNLLSDLVCFYFFIFSFSFPVFLFRFCRLQFCYFTTLVSWHDKLTYLTECYLVV